MLVALRASIDFNNATSTKIFFDAASRKRISRVGQHFHDPCEPFGGRHLCLLFERSRFGFGHFEHREVSARNLENQQIAEMI